MRSPGQSRNRRRPEPDNSADRRLPDHGRVPDPGRQGFVAILNESTRVLPTDEPLLTRGQAARAGQPVDARRERAWERELWEIVAEIRRVSGRPVSLRTHRDMDGSTRYEFPDLLCLDADSARRHAFGLLLKVLDGRPWPPRYTVWE